MLATSTSGAHAAERLAAIVGGRVVRTPAAPGEPRRGVVDSRAVSRGDLFLGVPGRDADGGAFAAEALARGAWGVVVAAGNARAAAAGSAGGAVIAVEDPLAAGEALAAARRERLGAPVVGITGSNGKTAVKDLLAALLRPARRVAATAGSFNTRLGVVATLLGAPADTEVLVVEVGMRAPGDIASRCAVARPTIGVITNIGRAHLAGARDLPGVAAAKAELIAALPPGAACVVPAGEDLLAPHLRAEVRTIPFGEGGRVRMAELRGDGVTVEVAGRRHALELPSRAPHDLANALAAVAACEALGEAPASSPRPAFAPLRGERVALPGGAVAVLDCFSANPESMEAALRALVAAPARRRLAVLGAMEELGCASEELHREVGERAARLGVDQLVLVGERAAAIGARFSGPAHRVTGTDDARRLIARLAGPGDRVLVKGSRAARLERIVADGRA